MRHHFINVRDFVPYRSRFRWWSTAATTRSSNSSSRRLLFRQRPREEITLSKRFVSTIVPTRWHSSSSSSSCLLVSPIIEPPLESSVIEKPATILLFEDPDLYDNTSISWLSAFEEFIPRKYGISFASIRIPPSETSGSTNNNINHQYYAFQEILASLKNELTLINHDAIMVTRGPLSSWFAVSYLESCQLKGLIMIDPVQLDSHNLDPIKKKMEEKDKASTSDDNRLGGWFRLLEEAKERKLSIEPNSVPMMIFCSDPSMKDAANIVSRRHSFPDEDDDDDDDESVPVIQISPSPKEETKEQGGGNDKAEWVITKIDEWSDIIL